MKTSGSLRGEVIAIGDELTTGARLDTNSRWLSAELAILGVDVAFHTTVGDTLADGVEAFRIAGARADVVVATGGLGPTADDLTRDVLAAVSGEPLEESAAAMRAIESRFASRGAAMPATNRRQAAFPRGAEIVPNPEGTAPGIALDLGQPDGRRCRIVALPGVPAEMRTMWHDTVAASIAALVPGRATIVQRRIKCFGAGESAIEAMLPDMVRRGREPLVGITAHEGTITLRIAARGRDERECAAAIAADEATIRRCLGELAYGVEDDELEDAALARLAASGLSLATVEVGTEGRVAALLAQAHGRLRGAPAAAAFLGGRVSATIGAAADAAALAAAARREFAADLGLGVGPRRPGAGGREVVDIALDGPDGIRRAEHVLGGGAGLAGARAAKTAIDVVRRALAASGPAGEPGS